LVAPNNVVFAFWQSFCDTEDQHEDFSRARLVRRMALDSLGFVPGCNACSNLQDIYGVTG
jgi:hypothetical protein